MIKDINAETVCDHIAFQTEHDEGAKREQAMLVTLVLVQLIESDLLSLAEQHAMVSHFALLIFKYSKMIYENEDGTIDVAKLR